MSKKTTPSLNGCNLAKDLNQKDERSIESPSDDFVNRKKLKEAETQLRSLCLILEEQHSGKCSGIDYVALKESKIVLETKVRELGQCVLNYETRPENVDTMKSMIDGNHEVAATTNYKSGLVDELDKENLTSNEKVSYENSGITKSTTERFSEMHESSENSSFVERDACIVRNEEAEFLRDENVRLRRKLSEAQLKHKSERDSVMKQLRVLEVETIDSEKHWANEIQDKQHELENYRSANEELTKKNEELVASLEEIKMQRYFSLNDLHKVSAIWRTACTLHNKRSACVLACRCACHFPASLKR